jgi:hypothetical protein
MLGFKSSRSQLYRPLFKSVCSVQSVVTSPPPVSFRRVCKRFVSVDAMDRLCGLHARQLDARIGVHLSKHPTHGGEFAGVDFPNIKLIAVMVSAERYALVFKSVNNFPQQHGFSIAMQRLCSGKPQAGDPGLVSLVEMPPSADRRRLWFTLTLQTQFAVRHRRMMRAPFRPRRSRVPLPGREAPSGAQDSRIFPCLWGRWNRSAIFAGVLRYLLPSGPSNRCANVLYYRR